MKKFYATILLVFFVSSITLTAQDQLKRTKPVDPKPKTEKKRLLSKKLKNNATLRSTPEVFQPDSALVYSGNGKLVGKRYFQFGVQPQDITVEEYKWSDSLNVFVLDSKYTELFDDKGNEIFDEEYYLDEQGNWNGYKYIYDFTSENKEAGHTSYRWSYIKNEWLETYFTKEEVVADGIQKYSGHFLYDSIENVYDGSKYVEEFDSKDLIKREYGYRWSADDNKWVNYDLEWNDYLQKWDTAYYTYVEYVYTFSGSDKPATRESYRKKWDSDKISSFENKSEYKYDSQGNVIEDIQYYGTYAWVVGDTTGVEFAWAKSAKELSAYDSNNNMIYMERQTWEEDKWKNSHKAEYKYDNRGNRTFAQSWNADWNSGEWVNNYKSITKFDNRDEEILNESYYWNIDSISGGYWQGRFYEMSEYTDEGWEIYYEDYTWDDESRKWTLAYKWLSEFDSNKNPSIQKEYEWVDGEWTLVEYTILYPYVPANDIEIEETKPINDDNEESNFEGKFALVLNIASDAIPVGTFDIVLPDGFTLDEEATRLSEELESKAYMTLQEKGNNVWTVTITEGSLRAASNVVYKNILDVAYKVDESVAANRNEILLKNMVLSLSTGGVISKEEMKVTVAPKTVTGLENGSENTKDITLVDGILTVDTPQAEIVSVYSVSGKLIYAGKKQEGEFTVNVKNISESVIIVKGSSGWSAKFINN